MRQTLFCLILSAISLPESAIAQEALEAEAQYTIQVTAPVDDMPDAFSISDASGVSPGAVISSSIQQVKGVNAPVQISVSDGGSFLLPGGSWQSTPATVENLQFFQVRLTAPSTFSATKAIVLTVGSRATTINISTAAADTTPDAFAFAAITGAELSTSVTSAAMTVAGINAAAPISITGGSYSINGGSFTSVAGTVSSGDSVRVQLTSLASYLSGKTATLTIGGVAAGFSVTTRAASTMPSAFTFGARVSTTMTGTKDSPIVTISGIEAGCATGTMAQGAYRVDTGATLTRSSHYWRKNSGTWGNASQTICNGDTVQAQVNVSAAGSAYIWWTSVTIGGRSATFEVQK